MKKILLLLLTSSLSINPVQADVTFDGSTGQAKTLSGDTLHIQESDGIRLGNNLFHSYETFNINQGQTAIFSGSDNLNNIINRVTGNEISNIDGTIISLPSNANFYLINPNGLALHENARIYVPQALYLSTADTLNFDSESLPITAIELSNKPLLSADPTAFGFLDQTLAAITFNNSRLVSNSVLMLVAGDIEIHDTRLFVPEGKLIVISLNQADTILSNQAERLITLNSGGHILITESATILAKQQKLQAAIAEEEATGSVNLELALETLANLDVSGEGGGQITLQGKVIEIDNAHLFADTFGDKAAQGITLHAETIHISNTARLTSEVEAVEATGSAGNILLTANQIHLDRGAQIVTNTESPNAGKAGDIRLTANESIHLIGKTRIPTAALGSGTEKSATDLPTALNSYSVNNSPAGDITLIAPTIIIADAANVGAASLGNGEAGNIQIEANSLTLKQGGVIDNSKPSTFFATINSNNTANGSQITINAKHKIEIIGQQFVIQDTEQNNIKSGIRSNNLLLGDGGTIKITTPKLYLSDHAAIESSTAGDGSAGAIIINSNELCLDNHATISSLVKQANNSGQGGDIVIQTHSLKLANAASISVDSEGLGNAGNLILTANSITLSKQAQLEARAVQAGGGNLKLTVKERLYALDSRILAQTIGDETADAAGNIHIQDARFIILQQTPLNASANAGKGGNINIQADYLIRTPSSVFNVTSRRNVDGEVEITAFDDDISEELLPAEVLLDVSEILNSHCKVTSPETTSSLTTQQAKKRYELPTDLQGSY